MQTGVYYKASDGTAHEKVFDNYTLACNFIDNDMPKDVETYHTYDVAAKGCDD